MAKPYNALNGLELKQVILDQIAKSLENTGEFTLGVTFPCVDIEWTVSLKVYPRETAEVKVSGGVHERERDYKPHRKPYEAELEHETKSIGAEVVGDPTKQNIELRQGVSPDTVRAEHGIKVVKPIEDTRAVMVEK